MAEIEPTLATSPEDFLLENGWAKTKHGWQKSGAFGEPLPMDSAYKIQAILDDIEASLDETLSG